MEWLTKSEAEIWLKLQTHKHKKIKTKDIKKTTKTKALTKKLHDISEKKWMLRLKRGEYYIPSFDEIIENKVKPYKIKTLEDIKKQNIPLVLGAPANSEIYWYPMRKTQRIYALKKHINHIDTNFVLREMTEETLKKSIQVDNQKMLSLEDTITESLKDNDVQAAMAMAHRLHKTINWNYLTKRIKEERVEKLAYIALDRFPQAQIFKHDELSKLSDTFIKHALKQNKVHAMTTGL